MKRVKLGGRVLRIEDNAVAEFLKKGYSVIDDKGNVVQKGDVTTFGQAVEEIKSLEASNALLRLKIKELEEENEALKKKLSAAKKKADESK